MAQKANQTQTTDFKGSSGAIIFDIIASLIAGALGWIFIGWVGGIVAFLIVLAILASLSIKIVPQYAKIIVFRLGTYVGTAGPGVVAIYPIIYSVPYGIDLRVINTAFKAEKTLTKDSIPVDIDAVLFWQVEDAHNAALNVQNYQSSVQMAAQTALKDAIGKKTLAEVLAGRTEIGKEIDELIEGTIEDFGINAISVEIRDVQIPANLQEAMAAVATADREKTARVTLAESESLAADKMLEAAKKYEGDPVALQLRSLNIMYEVARNDNNKIIFIPTENKGGAMPMPLGVLSLEEMAKQPKKPKHKPKEEDD